ncbi:hypothetical protein U732_4169 [Clostridium argentinense CDC 2741]|uniref:UPF0182 protein U732_4169 n=1 Tax=Clostridium argentinense CDC 2741 TaxID=1418104 RepID=A0A0C1RDC7_9CLOT|nr:UPF0182 family protein [Clostridium argentinense]ARC83304.1 hypothetical protein RSJ17_01405 [Clostridium argentinense]KIE48386.1 hypothetical protein U732_4169 [Clostridium argentinense CDC 2741]NFF41472.1 hypothetical protein [Clostridium argentinense]NFP52134.1 hypothetical protein [Clostridium argentinense]NFP74511.1 hypothetical protein [Clostridium argentinense]
MKKKGIVFSFIIMIILILLVLASSINILVDYQWFKELGYLSIYFKRVVATLKLMIPVFIIIFTAITVYYISLKPSIMKMRKVIERNRAKEKKIFKVFLIINALVSMFFSYIFASNYWYRILEFTNSTTFNLSDPIFNKDISFYVFKLPLIQSLYSSIISLLVILVIITFIIYISFSAKDKIQDKVVNINNKSFKSFKSGITNFAGKQLAVLSALIMLFIAFGYMISAWNLVYSPQGAVFGASYTDMKVSLKFYRAISIVGLVASVVVFFSIITSKVKPIIYSIVLMFVLIIGEGISTTFVEKFIVQSNEKTLEKPFIEYNIDYTRKAFNIDGIKEENYNVINNLTQKDIKDNKDIIDNIKINAYKPALEFNNQFQYIRYYYGFNDIDIDRYNINGKYSQVFIAPRELDLNKLDDNSNTWQNRHLSYTHGYGVVMSKVNSVTSEGQPNFVISNVPIENKTDIKIDNPRIYFGESTNDYSIVNTDLGEIDYPMSGKNVTNNYDGEAGIRMSMLNRILFSFKYQNPKFILSQDINRDSQILIHRNIKERVNKIAPFLQYDRDPYIVVDNGKLYWIMDAYTVTDKFPFSQPLDNNVNYMRNSVKVIIDAFNGTTNFYVVDKNDPIAVTYSKIFPQLFKDVEEAPKSLRDHFKYPEDLFNIQCQVLGKYHVEDPGVFYNGDDVWSIASDKEKIDGSEEEKLNEASYVIMRLPNETKDEMVVLEYFNTKGRDNMVAMYGVRMDGENYGQMFLYKFPTGGTVYSPMLFKQKLHQDPEISKELSLWDTKGSEVQFGEVLIIPIEKSLLYVEPLYLRAAGEKSIPEMKNVIVGYGDQIVLANNIESALAQLFNYEDKAGDENKVITATDNADIKKIKELYDKAIEAQKNGDWAKYGEYINSLGKEIEKVSK